jgi:hypothetical protein
VRRDEVEGGKGGFLHTTCRCTRDQASATANLPLPGWMLVRYSPKNHLAYQHRQNEIPRPKNQQCKGPVFSNLLGSR